MSEDTVYLLKEIVLVLFFCIFVGVVLYAIRMPQSEVDAMRHLPLASDDYPSETRGGQRG